MILCDTNIFIHAFNRHQPTIDAITEIGLTNIVLSSVTVMELYRGMGNKAELSTMTRKLSFYDVVHLQASVSERAVDLIRAFKLSHGLQIPDALIGATSIVTGIPLFTYNRKDFMFMPGIELYEF